MDYAAEMQRIQRSMRDLMVREQKSQRELIAAFEGIGYGIE